MIDKTETRIRIYSDDDGLLQFRGDWGRRLSEAEIFQLLTNPWQIFQAPAIKPKPDRTD